MAYPALGADRPSGMIQDKAKRSAVCHYRISLCLISDIIIGAERRKGEADEYSETNRLQRHV